MPISFLLYDNCILFYIWNLNWKYPIENNITTAKFMCLRVLDNNKSSIFYQFKKVENLQILINSNIKDYNETSYCLFS